MAVTKVLVFLGEDREIEYLTPSFLRPAVSPFSEDISAAKYLKYAEADYSESSDRGLINALGNAKRALHLIVDYTLHAYGLLRHVKRDSFPRKLEMLDKAGLLPISILKQLNLERNVMEHEYGVPPSQRVAEAIDVTRILLLATRQIWKEVPYECTVGIVDSPTRHAVIRLYPDLGVLRFFRLTATEENFEEYRGVKYVANLRAYTPVKSGIEVEQESFREISLRPSNVEEWSLWITALVKIGVGLVGDMRDVHLVPWEGTIRFPITVPLRLDGIDQIEATISTLDSGIEGDDVQP